MSIKIYNRLTHIPQKNTQLMTIFFFFFKFANS